MFLSYKDNSFLFYLYYRQAADKLHYCFICIPHSEADKLKWESYKNWNSSKRAIEEIEEPFNSS